MTDPADALPLAVLQYLALRADDRSFEAARVRKTFSALADAALLANAAERAKRPPLMQWTPSGPIPLKPRGQRANDNHLSGEAS